MEAGQPISEPLIVNIVIRQVSPLTVLRTSLIQSRSPLYVGQVSLLRLSTFPVRSARPRIPVSGFTAIGLGHLIS